MLTMAHGTCPFWNFLSCAWWKSFFCDRIGCYIIGLVTANHKTLVSDYYYKRVKEIGGYVNGIIDGDAYNVYEEYHHIVTYKTLCLSAGVSVLQRDPHHYIIRGHCDPFLHLRNVLILSSNFASSCGTL
jgi:hypothetical protein